MVVREREDAGANASAEPGTSASGRPRFVTWLCVGVLILAAAQLTRFIASLTAPRLSLTVPLAWLTVSGALWGAVSLVLAFGLWTGRLWAPVLLRLAGIAFLAAYWVDRLTLARTDLSVHTWPWAALATIGVLVIVAAGFRRNDVRTYFEENPA